MRKIKVSGNDLDFSVTKYYYNEYTNMLEKVVDPMLYEETYKYNLNGNLEEKVDRNNYITTYEYDGLGRIKSTNVVTPDAKKNVEYSYTYTLTGNKRTVSSGGITYIYL